jgi:hypothetical protein
MMLSESQSEAVRGWFAGASGLKAIWENDKRPFMATGRFVTLHVLTVASVGVDETRYVWNATTEKLEPVQCGYRTITVTVHVESQDQTPEKAARWYLELIRTKLRTPAALATFAAQGLALIETLPSINLDALVEDRWLSRARLDIRFGMAVEYAAVDEAVEHIAQVEVSSEIDNVDGTPLPASVQLTEEILP